MLQSSSRGQLAVRLLDMHQAYISSGVSKAKVEQARLCAVLAAPRVGMRGGRRGGVGVLSPGLGHVQVASLINKATLRAVPQANERLEGIQKK